MRKAPDVSPKQLKTDKPKAVVAKSGSNPAFARMVAQEIVKNLVAIGQFTTRPFTKDKEAPEKPPDLGINPVLVDTSVLIDGRIVSIVESGFVTGTLLIPQFVLGEVQHVADSSDMLRRTKGRKGLDVAGKLRWQKANPLLKAKVISDDVPLVKEIDHKLVALAHKWRSSPGGKYIRLMTVDYNLATLARAQGITVLNVTDMALALKLSAVAGEELTVKIAHEGKERNQGVGYLPDGTMIVIEETKTMVGQDVVIIITKIHQTPAGQLFFARLR